jgi:serine/threonine protein kinase
MCIYTYIEESVAFFADSELEMQLNAQNKELVLPKTFSASLCDLLQQMLAKSPEKRPTIKQLQTHIWFTK